jgi:hypothetical protein
MGQLVNLFLVASNFNFLERIFSLQKIHLKYTIFLKKKQQQQQQQRMKNLNLIKIAKKNFLMFFLF